MMAHKKDGKEQWERGKREEGIASSNKSIKSALYTIGLHMHIDRRFTLQTSSSRENR